MQENFAYLIGCLIGFAFFSVRLFCAVRDGSIFISGVWPPIIQKQSSPWNFMAAILIQAVFALGFAVGIAIQLKKLLT